MPYPPLSETLIHDLNNILASIMGYTELAIEEIPKNNPALPHLFEILKATRQAKDMLNRRRSKRCPERAAGKGPGGLPKVSPLASLPRGQEESILLIDDEESVAYVEQKMLAYLGYKVFLKTSGLEALEAFRAQPQGFDLVIVDQVMPDISGTDLARELMTMRPDIPIILCTGFHEEATPERIKDLGIKDLLFKPIDLPQMAQTVRSVLSAPAQG